MQARAGRERKKVEFFSPPQAVVVFAQALEPRTSTWIVLDPVAADKTSEMMGRIKAAAVWPVA